MIIRENGDGIKTNRCIIEDEFKTDHKMKKLAITGFSRSGTTALTDLLNIDPRIKITYEKRDFTDNRTNRRRKWDDRNAALEQMDKHPIYIGDKSTRPYLRDWEQLRANTDKIIFCLRDPRDIFRSKYWKLIKEDPVEMYIELMGPLVHRYVSECLPIWYEDAVCNASYTSRLISEYLELETPIDITGHNYKPVRRLGWIGKSSNAVHPKVYEIMKEFGY